MALEWTFYLQAVQSYASLKYEWQSARNLEKMCLRACRRVNRPYDTGLFGHIEQWIWPFKGCAIEAHQNAVLYRMLKKPRGPKTRRSAFANALISPWWSSGQDSALSPPRPGFDSRSGKQEF